MNNVLTAKEWLEKDGKQDGVCKNNPYIPGCATKISNVMEQYASYRTKELEIEFNKFWKETTMKILELEGKIEFIKEVKLNNDIDC